jgi:hypothetical protein
LAGFRSEKTAKDAPSTVMASSPISMCAPNRPCTESYFRRWAIFLMEPLSLTPTTSMSSAGRVAR